jgi:hypothetical protein
MLKVIVAPNASGAWLSMRTLSNTSTRVPKAKLSC